MKLVYSNDIDKNRKYRKLCIRIANAYGYKDELTKDKIELVLLNLTRWQSVNKLQKLLYGKCI